MLGNVWWNLDSTLYVTHTHITSPEIFQQLWCWLTDTGAVEKKTAGYSDSIWDSTALYHIAILLNHLLIRILPFTKFIKKISCFTGDHFLRVFFQPKKTYSTCFLPLSPGRPNPGTSWVYLVSLAAGLLVGFHITMCWSHFPRPWSRHIWPFL